MCFVQIKRLSAENTTLNLSVTHSAAIEDRYMHHMHIIYLSFINAKCIYNTQQRNNSNNTTTTKESEDLSRGACLFASCRKSGSMNRFKSRSRLWLFRACVMHPAIIIRTIRSLWTWLWGRYYVPHNVFLVVL